MCVWGGGGCSCTSQSVAFAFYDRKLVLGLRGYKLRGEIKVDIRRLSERAHILVKVAKAVHQDSEFDFCLCRLSNVGFKPSQPFAFDSWSILTQNNSCG